MAHDQDRIDEEQKNRLLEAENIAFLRGEIALLSPQSYALEEKGQIIDDMDRTTADIERFMREDFQRLDEVAQTKLLDLLGTFGQESREWWRRTLMDHPKNQELPSE